MQRPGLDIEPCLQFLPTQHSQVVHDTLGNRRQRHSRRRRRLPPTPSPRLTIQQSHQRREPAPVQSPSRRNNLRTTNNSIRCSVSLSELHKQHHDTQHQRPYHSHRTLRLRHESLQLGRDPPSLHSCDILTFRNHMKRAQGWHRAATSQEIDATVTEAVTSESEHIYFQKLGKYSL